MRAPLPPVLHAGRHPEPRERADAGLDPRGRRARLRRSCTRSAPRSTTPTCSWPCVVGDGEAETGPLEGSWKGVRFLNPARDGAVLPILHLNGYKIAGPTVLGRADDDDVRGLLARPRLRRRTFVEGDDPTTVHAAFAGDARRVLRRGSARSRRRRASGGVTRRGPRWPAIVLRTPEGLDRARRSSTACRSRARSARTRCRWRTCATNPEHLAMLEDVDAQLPARGALRRRRAARRRARGARARRATAGWARTRTPTAAGCCGRSTSPTSRPTRSTVAAPGTEPSRVDARRSASCCATSTCATSADELPALLPRRDQLEPARRGVRGRGPLPRRTPIVPTTITSSPDGRVMEVLSEHNCQGWLEGYLLTGRHGLFATYEAFAMVVGVDGRRSTPSGSRRRRTCRGARRCRRSTSCSPRPAGATTTTASATRARASSTRCSRSGAAVARVYLPPDANCLLSVADHCLRSRDYVNLIVIDKQPQLQWLDIDAAQRALRARRVASGTGPAPTTADASPTSCWPAPATSRRWRRSLPRGCCASTCPSCGCASSTSST